MTEKLCPLRFREFTSDPTMQACIGETCKWSGKCNDANVAALESENARLSSDEFYLRAENIELHAKVDELSARPTCPYFDAELNECNVHCISVDERAPSRHYVGMIQKQNMELFGKVDELERDNARMLSKVRELRDLLEDAEYERDRLQEKLDDDWRYVSMAKTRDIWMQKYHDLKASLEGGTVVDGDGEVVKV